MGTVVTWARAVRDRQRTAIRPFLLGELLVVFLLLEVYDYVKSLEEVRRPLALRNGEEVWRVEQLLHIDVEGTANAWLSQHQTLSTVLVSWYQYTHITVTMSVLACCYIGFPSIYRAARTSLALTNVVGMFVFVVLPVMPPRLLPGAGFVDSVAAAGYGSTHGGPVEPAQFAAMPSLHLAWAVWVAIVGYAMLGGRAYRAVAFVYPLLTTIAVVSTANHYVLDVVAGAALALGTCAVCGLIKHARTVRVPSGALEPVPVGAIDG